MRVLHGPVNVGNQPWVLSRHERALGLESDLVINYNTWLTYPNDCTLGEIGKRTPGAVWKRLRFALSSPFRYQVLHYYFGRSFMCWDDYGRPNALWFSDLRLARRLGRKVFMTVQGCDVRLSDESAARNQYTPCHIGHCPAAPTCRAVLDQRRRELIQRILPLMDRVFYLNPEQGHFLRNVPSATFLPYASVDVEAFEPVPPRTDRTPVIVHAPSDEGIKGSRMIIEAVERLKQRMPLEFVLIKGVPHAEALKLYQQADLVIDQVLTGWYGGFAVEVMAMGKPVACYIRPEDLGYIPAGMQADLPFVRLTPDTVETDLEMALQRQQEWAAWGQQARDYVLHWHHPRRIAQAMKNAYEHPESWFDLEAT